MHITAAPGGSWSSPHTVVTYPSTHSAAVALDTLAQNAGGGMDVWAGDGTANVNWDNGLGLTCAGNMNKWSRDSPGNWTGPIQELAKGSQPFDYPATILNGPVNARVFVSEIATGTIPYQTLNGALKGYVIGDSGVVPRIIQSYNPLTEDLIGHITSVPSNAYLAAMDALITGLYNDGTWFLLAGMWVLAADSPQMASLCWNDPSNFGLTVGGGAPVFTRNQKYAFNGTSDYLTTSLNPSTYLGGLDRLIPSGNNKSSGIVAWFPSLIGTTNAFGCSASGNGLYLEASATALDARCQSATDVSVSQGNGIGFAGAYRPTGANTVVLQSGATQSAPQANTVNTVSCPSAAIFGGISPFSLFAGECSMGALIGTNNSTPAQFASFNTRFATYLDAITGL